MLELFFRKKGESGEPLIILHGLYGSGDNWISIANELKDYFQVYLIDQRNHGRSPHADDMSYESMAEDLHEFIKSQNLESVNIIGHSMGGKTAMWFTAAHPDKVKKLIVADIAPGKYDTTSPNVKTHKKIIAALKSIDPSEAKTRKEIETQLSRYIDNVQLRMFLLKNIERKEDGCYRWKINIDSIEKNIINIMSGITGIDIPVHVPALFLKGELSDYITDKDIPLIKEIFPDAKLVTIPGAGHWLHAQQPKIFIQKTLEFLRNRKTVDR
uniref:Esterase n=1 Tax=uncultured bacterium TaxID=77133 RepID=A0ACD6B919_9BACT|nr:putative esterase [uncultured bacterium]